MHVGIDGAQDISIHAPHAGSDEVLNAGRLVVLDFNPRSPCGERRGRREPSATVWAFQSTLPMRGATSPHQSKPDTPGQFQSTLPMRGATQR